MYEVSVFPVKKNDAGGWVAELDEPAHAKRDIDNPIAALAMALSRRAKGACVIMRPKFNEAHLGGRYSFREWCSFDGELFREVHWPEFGLGCSIQIRLDEEIILPQPPSCVGRTAAREQGAMTPRG